MNNRPDVPEILWFDFSGVRTMLIRLIVVCDVFFGSFYYLCSKMNFIHLNI